MMVEETTVVINPDPEHERSPTPELDPTVESGKFLVVQFHGIFFF